MCKLNAVIFCTPDGLFMRIPDDKLIQASQLLTHTEVTTAYLWRLLGKPSVEICSIENIQSLSKTSPYLAVGLTQTLPFETFHCNATLFNDVVPIEYQQKTCLFLNHTDAFNPITQLYIGPAGCAAVVSLTKKQFSLLHDDTVPHIILAISPTHTPQELKNMIKTLHNTKPISSSANSTGILHTLQSDGWRLDLKTPLFANSSCTFEKHSPAPSPDYSPPQSLSQVPSKLWAMHKNHAGFVTSSPPLKVTLKSDATLPCIQQYHLSPKALDGIQRVITLT